MPFVHGRSAAFYLTDAVATQRNLTAFVDSVDFSMDEDASETTTLGNSARTYVPGLYTGTIEISGKWDNGGTATPDQWIPALITAGTISPTFNYAANGSAAGRPFQSGACIVTNYAASSPYDDVVTWSASMQITGAITRGTF